MKKVLSAVLSICLLVNTWLPYAWGQTVPTVKTPDLHKVLQGSAAERIAKRQARIAELEKLISQEKDAKKLTAYLQEVDRLRSANERDRQLDAKINEKVAQPMDATRVQKPIYIVQTDTSWDAFLAKKRTNTLKFEDLIEYANPVSNQKDPSAAPQEEDFRVITQAAEMIGNNLDALNQSNCTEEIFAFVNNALQSIQVRLLYQLYKMEKYRPSGYDNMMRMLAVSTLRITLLKIKQFYDRIGKPNPVRFAATDGDFKVQAGKDKAVLSSHQNPAINYEEVSDTPSMWKDRSASFRPEKVRASAFHSFGLADGNNQSVDPYEDAFNMFVFELKSYASQKPEQTGWDYQTLSILAEGATLYTLLYDPKRLPEIVRVFDTGAETDGDFGRLYSPILNSIFINVFETVRFSDFSSQKSQQVVDLLLAFSDPNQYSIPTQIFALEAASLIFRSFNVEYRESLQNPTPSFLPIAVNSFKPRENYRRIFADRTAHVYCPLTGRSSPEYDYGLDSAQMAELAAKLAYIYDGFYDILSPTVSAPTDTAHPHPATPCYIVGRSENNLNTYKQKQERDLDALLFVGETIFWVYTGFEVFRLLGTVYRMTRGAIAVMPRALSTARAAQPGTRMASFTNTVRQGAQGSNLIESSAKHGFQYFERVPVDSKAAVQTVEINGTKIGLKPIYSPHTRQLVQGKWNYYKGGPVRDAIKPMAPKDIYVRDGAGRLFKMDVTRAITPTVEEGLASPLTLEGFQPFTLGSKYDLFGQATRLTSVGHNEMPVLLSANEARLARITERWSGWFARTMEPYQRLENGLWWARSWGRPPVAFASSSQVMMVPKPASSWFSAKWAQWLKKPELFEPKTLAQLTQTGGMSTSISALESGTWMRQALNTYFTEVDYHAALANYVLPRYFLNGKGISLLLKNPSLAPSMSGFAALPITLQAAFFGGLQLIDKMAFNPYVAYMKDIRKDNLEEMKASYGDTFSEENMAKDRDYRKMQEIESRSMPRDPRADYQMDVYRRVLSVFRPITKGASTALVQLGFKDMVSRVLDGHPVQLLSAQDVKNFAINAYNLENARAAREGGQLAQKQAEQNAREEFERRVWQDEQELYTSNPLVAELLIFDPELKTKIHQAYADYLQAFFALDKAVVNKQMTLEQKTAHHMQLFDQLVNQVNKHIDQTKAEYEGLVARAFALFGNPAEGEVQETQDEWNASCEEHGANYKNWMAAAYPTMKDYPALHAKVTQLVDDYIKIKKESYTLSMEERNKVIANAYETFSNEIGKVIEEFNALQSAGNPQPQEDTSNPQAQTPQDVY